MKNDEAKSNVEKALQVKAEQLEILFTPTIAVAIVHISVAILMVHLLWDQTRGSHDELIVFAASIFAIVVVRLLLFVAYKRKPLASSQVNAWEKRFLIGSIAIALVWALTEIWLFPTLDKAHQFIMVLLIGGIAALGTITLSPMRTAYITFILIMLLPITMMIFLQSYHDATGIGLLLVILLTGLLSGAERNCRNIVQNIILRIESNEREIALAESEAKYSGIVEQAEDAIISVDEEQRITLFNPAAERMFGYSREDILGSHVNELIPERCHETHRAAIDQVRGAESKIIRRKSGMTGLRRNGEEFPLEIAISSQRLNNSVIMTVIIRDITERVKSEELLRKLSQAVDQAGESVLITDRHGTIEYVNPAFTEITGYTPAEVIGKDPSILKSDAQDPSSYKELWETITRGEVWHGTLLDRKKDGSLFPALMSVAPIQDKSFEITHYVGILQDLTKHQQLEEQFQQAQKMEAIGTLVGGIAHDFNNMLAGIIGNIFIAKGEVGDNVDVIKNLENVEVLSNRAADMIKQLLTFARKDIVQMRIFAIVPFFKEALKLAHSAIPENIELSYNISAEDMLIQGDSTQLQQLIMNLLNNARDAVADVPLPTIHCQLESFSADDSFRKKHPDIKRENFVRLTVSDNGHGIPQDQQDRVFEPFFTSKSMGKGTGLGLSMVFGAVQRHNGVIELESEEGKGTAFHIYLPLEEEQVEPGSKKTAEIVQGRGETILLVDDEESMRSTVGKVLSGLGYKVLEAANGEEGLKIFKSNLGDIDLLITDLIMPIMGGLELAKAIQQLDENMPIIFATGYDRDHVLEESDIHLDNSMVISKPFSFNDLSQLIRTIIKAE